MRNPKNWRPGKYQIDAQGRLIPRPGKNGISPASWLMAALVGECYATSIPLHCKGARLLDLGCGAAPLYPLYKQVAQHIVLADWPQSLHVSPCLDCHLDLSRPLPFRDESFDAVILSDVLEHLPEPDKALAEIHRITAPGGWLLLNVPFLYWIHEAPHDYYRFTEHSLRRLVSSVGFRIETLRPLGGGREVMADLASKLLEDVPIASGLSKALQRLIFSWRRKRTQPGQPFPLAYFLELQRLGAEGGIPDVSREIASDS